MTLEEELAECIGEEAKKLIDRFHLYHNTLHINCERKKKQTSKSVVKVIKTPSHWNHNDRFNPFYVYKRRKKIAHSIANKISTGEYSPNQPYTKRIPKPLGGSREVAIYEIPDSAVSKYFYSKLLAKNRHRFSSFSYAYRNDRNVHFAIQDMSIELRQKSRIFIAEFDFSKFFDSISHDFLFEQFTENSFQITDIEKSIVKSFLKDRPRGTPQGTSISLFLANLVCWSLDKNLERAGLQFARYADDTVIWSSEYQKINQAFEIMFEFSKNASVAVNLKKSDGISILCHRDMPVEIGKRKEKVDFLGYSISVDKVSIKEKSVNRIKRQISYILYSNLIQPLCGATLASNQLPTTKSDAALLSAISEIRRFLYGDLTEEMINRYLKGLSKRIFFKGIMSFYPLVNDDQQLAELDGWLVNAIYKAIKKRRKLLLQWSYPNIPAFPFKVAKSDMILEFRIKKINSKRLFQIPSFRKIHKALSKGLQERGVEGVMNKASNYYDY